MKRYPKSEFGKEGTPFPPIVERLTSAGAQRVVMQYFKSSVFFGVVVILPTEAAAGREFSHLSLS